MTDVKRKPDRATRASTNSVMIDQSLSCNSPLHRLKAFVLLAGSVRPSQLSQSINRSLLDLPIDSTHNVLQIWLDHARNLAQAINQVPLHVRVICDATSPLPQKPNPTPNVNLQFQRDTSDLRGTAGVLRDLAQDYQDDDFMLVASAAQVLFEPLSTLSESLAAKGGDVSLVAHSNGIPSGLMLIRCICLRSISPIGFVDLKEQALPIIAKTHQVRVLRSQRPTGLPIRTLSDYIAILDLHHRRLLGKADKNPMDQELNPLFALIEDDALIAPDAIIHNSVVLKGARLDRRAVAVNSVVCNGGLVPKGTTVVNQIVTAL